MKTVESHFKRLTLSHFHFLRSHLVRSGFRGIIPGRLRGPRRFPDRGCRGRGDGARGSQLNPCAAPNKIGDSFEETAWQIWVAATCPVNSDQYPFTVWENWIEQAQLFPTDPSKGLKVPNAGASAAEHIVHASPLTLALDPGLTTSVPSGLLGSP